MHESVQVGDLWAEIGMGTPDKDHLEYEVVSVINDGMGNYAEERIGVVQVRWDHENRQLLLIQP